MGKKLLKFYLKKSFYDHFHFLFIPMIFLVGLDDQVQVSSPDVLLQHGLDVVPEVAVLARKPFTPDFKLRLLLVIKHYGIVFKLPKLAILSQKPFTPAIQIAFIIVISIGYYCLKIAQTCDTYTKTVYI